MAGQSGLPNYYEILGVAAFASKATIMEAHAALIQKLNSEQRIENLDRKDENLEGPSESRQERRRLIEEAYLVLSNGRKRKDLDQLIADAKHEVYTVQGAATIRLPSQFAIDDRIYWEGVKHLHDGRFTKAAICFRKVIRFEKNNPFLLKLIAKAYQKAGESGFAVQAIEKAIKLEPDDWETHFDLGMLQEQKKKLHAARRSFRLAYRLNPSDPAVIVEFDRGSLLLEKAALVLKSGLNLIKPDPAAKSFRLSDGLITREMLMTWKLDAKLRHFFADCLPDPNARSFRLEDGLITRDLVVRLVGATAEKFKPKPNRFTFRFTWL